MIIKKIIDKYTKRKKLNNINIDIKNIINVKQLLISSFNHLKNFKEFNKDFKENLINLNYDNKQIVTILSMNFIRKNKKYKKDIYIIMNEEMESNIKEKDNIQFFTDIAYYAIPPKPVKYKILILLAFNNKEFKSILYSIALIANENKETLIKFMNFLKINII